MVNRVEMVRGAYGLCLLVAPRLLAGRVMGLSMTPGVVAVIRILGARHLAQALLLLRTRRQLVTDLGATVDVLHALSLLGVGVVTDSPRRAGLSDAAVAASFAAAEVLA